MQLMGAAQAGPAAVEPEPQYGLGGTVMMDPQPTSPLAARSQVERFCG